MPSSTNGELQRILTDMMASRETPVLPHDGSESEILRPVNHEDQKDKYSGKKKRHTVKNAVVTTVTGCMPFVGATVPGHVHNKRIADEQYVLPKEWTVYQYTGYVGYRPEPTRSCR